MEDGMGETDGATDREVGLVCHALCTLRTPDEVRAFLSDACSSRELSDLAQRMEVARLLAGGASCLEADPPSTGCPNVAEKRSLLAFARRLQPNR